MIDLHVHSNISDGSDRPSDIIKKAKKIGLHAVTLTDHDSIDGLEEARREADTLGVNFVNGIEFSVRYGKDRLIHILGLGFDPDHEVFAKGYTRYKQKREERLEQVFCALRQKGLNLNVEQLQKYATSSHLDRQTVAKWLVATKVVKKAPQAWSRFLDPIPYETGDLMEPEEVFDMIKQAGGHSFLAHYHKRIGLEGYAHQEMEERLKLLKAMGLDGIEGYYPAFSRENQDQVAYFMERIGLIASGGSDYHGSNRPEVELGGGMDGFCVPDAIYDTLFKRIR